MSSKEKGFSTRAESSNNWHRCVSVCSLRPFCHLQPDFGTMNLLLALCFVKLEALGGVGVGRSGEGSTMQLVHSYLFSGMEKPGFFVCLFVAVLDCAC